MLLISEDSNKDKPRSLGRGQTASTRCDGHTYVHPKGHLSAIHTDYSEGFILHFIDFYACRKKGQDMTHISLSIRYLMTKIVGRILMHK